MMKGKQILKMTGSVALSTVLIAATTMYGGVFADDNHQTEKTETVYSVLKPDGSVSDIVVSSWLHDEDGIRNIREKLNLMDVKNVKTDGAPEEENGVYTWNADGNDLYYQGKATEELPVFVEISYTLDGQEMTESELAGKSGHMMIHMHMDSTYGETKEINGRNVIIHPLFVAGGMLMLDNDHVSNVSCEQGRIMNDGSREMLMFVAVPGLKETLNSAGLSKVSDKLAVGDDVIVECDVQDYESTSLMMVMSNELDLKEVLDEGDSLDELTSGIDALMDADEQLLKGSRQLEEGTQQLIDKSLPLTSSSDSIRSLSKGTLSLNDGALQLQEALGQYTGGVSQLNDGIDALYSIPEGAAKLSEAITVTKDEQHPSLLYGISSLGKGITDFKNQIDETMAATDMSGMMESMQTANEVLSGMAMTVDHDLFVLNNLQSSLENTVNSLDAVQSTLQAAAGDINNAMALSLTALSEAEQSLPDGEAKTTVSNALETLRQQADVLNGAFSTINTTTGALTSSDGMMAELSSAITVLNGLQTDITNAEDGLQTLGEIVSSAKGSVETLSGMQSAIDGVCDELVAGTQSLEDGANALNAGIETLQKQSEAGIDAIKEATAVLSGNNDSLNGGIASLQNGTEKLAEQSGSFATMADGLDTLKEAFETLHTGAAQLADGQQQFKEEGLSSLKEKVELGVNELEMLQTMIDEVVAMNEKYREYAGNNEDMEVTTRYVFRTTTVTE